MRSFLLGTVAALGLCPSIASAVVTINVDRVNVVPGAAQTAFIEVFGVDVEGNVNEQLNSFTIALNGQFATSGIRFGDADPTTFSFPKPTGHPYVFQAFPAVNPEDFGSSATRIQVGAATAGRTEVADIAGGVTGSGFVRLPIVIPASVVPGFYPVVVDLGAATALAGAGAPIVRTAGAQQGGIMVVPEPASLGLIVLGGLLTLRRRRVA